MTQETLQARAARPRVPHPMAPPCSSHWILHYALAPPYAHCSHDIPVSVSHIPCPPHTPNPPFTSCLYPTCPRLPSMTSCPPYLVSHLPVHALGPCHSHSPITRCVPSSCPFMLCPQRASDGFWKSVATRVPKEPPEIRILNPYFIQEAAFTLIGLPFNNGLMGRGVR